jgi:hypothetical protein
MKSVMVLATVFVLGGCVAEDVPLDDDIESSTAASVVVDEDMKKLAQCNQDCDDVYFSRAFNCAERHSGPCEHNPRATCISPEDHEMCWEDLTECQDWCRSYPWSTSDMWNIRRLMRQACYSDCDSEENSCLAGACAIYGECGGNLNPRGGLNTHVVDCQASASTCNRGCACTFGGPNLGSC